MIRLVIADDHPIVLGGLEQLFRLEEDICVVETCMDGDAAIASVRRHKPDVLVLDLKMPCRNGLEVLKELSLDAHRCRTVMLTAALNEEEVVEAMRLGVNGIVLKEMAPRLLLQCVRKVAAGGQWLEKGSVGRAIEQLLHREQMVQKTREILTPREIEVVQMVARGLRNKEIAAQLGIGEGTVKVYLHTIYEKMTVTGRVELTLYAQKNGLA